MSVRELPPGSTVGDLVLTRSSDKDSFAANADQKELRVKVNHQFVDDMNQKLRMGDFVEVLTVSQPVPRPRRNLQCHRRSNVEGSLWSSSESS